MLTTNLGNLKIQDRPDKRVCELSRTGVVRSGLPRDRDAERVLSELWKAHVADDLRGHTS